MTQNLSAFEVQFENLTKKPTKFLSVQDGIKEDVKQLIKSLYDFTKIEESINEKTSRSCDALPELIISEFDEEQIWQQIELQNSSQWSKFIQDVATCVSSKDKLNFPVAQKQESNEAIQEELEEDMISTKIEEIQKNHKKKNKKSAIEKKRPGKTSVVDDEFFKLYEMERFLEQEDKREMFDEKQKKDKDDSEEDSIDLFEGSDDEEPDEEDDESYDVKYNDFFGGSDNENEVNNYDASINEEADSEKDCKSSASETGKYAPKKKSVRFNVAESSSDDDCDANTEEISKPVIDTSNSESKLSEYELRQQRLREKIRKLEEKNLGEKPWQLKGEVDASNRPQNSLLEEVVDFDLTTRPAPIITEETTLKLEDIIKQRIKDKVWDDVERKVKPVPETHEFRKSVVLDQEKSKISLAQVYEQEFLKQKRAATGDEQVTEEEPEQHKNIKKTMASLFAKLDALSNYHYTPKPAQAEVKIVSNIPAISMEEVAPVATSDAALLAPEEVKAKRKGDLMSKNERTATDKKRERRKKKVLQREKEKEKNKKENLINKLNPGLGNKYSKEKASKLLDKVSKDFINTDKMTQLNDVKALKSSKAFFTQLNDDVASSAKSKKKNKQLLPAKKYKL